MGGPLALGIIGLGKISCQYLDSLRSLPGLRLIAVADLDDNLAGKVAEAQGVDAMSVDAILADDRIDVILNLTVPAAHVEIDTRALQAGKHVYAEKPLAAHAPDEAVAMLKLAKERGLRIGSAPDTVLGTGVQTARAALDDGMIGRPVAASAVWSAPGHELWHPSPDFYYQRGGGPLYDMAPYYLTALITLLGPIARVSANTLRTSRARTIATGPRAGEEIQVNVDTHVSALLEHSSGVSSTLTMSFEVWGTQMAGLEVYGTEGTIAVPDPNQFSQPANVFTAESKEWRPLAVRAGYVNAGRGYGLADMAYAIQAGHPHRASGDLAFHVLDIMHSILKAGESRSVITVRSTVDRPAPVPLSETVGP